MATQIRRRLPAILFTLALVVPALPVFAGGPPEHANAHGHDKGSEPASAPEGNQSGGQSDLCKDIFPERNTATTSPVVVAGVELSWSGPTLSYQVEAGYALDLCLKSGTKIDLFSSLSGADSVSTSDGKDISHIGYLLTPSEDDSTVGTEDDQGTTEDDQGTTEDDQGTTEDDEGTTEDDQGTTEDDQGTTEDDQGTTEDDQQTTLPVDDKVTEEPGDEQSQESAATDVAAAVIVSSPPAAPSAAATAAPVTTPAAVSAPPADATVAAVFVAPETLPFTGAESTTILAYGASILLAGAGLLLAGRECKFGRHLAR